MSEERVLQSEIKSTSAFLITGVYSHIHQKQIEQPIVVKIEKYRGGRMADVIQSCLPGNILKSAAAQIFKQHITRPNSGDEKIRITVVVNVREGGRHTNPVGQTDPCFGGDVFKFSIA